MHGVTSGSACARVVDTMTKGDHVHGDQRAGRPGPGARIGIRDVVLPVVLLVIGIATLPVLEGGAEGRRGPGGPGPYGPGAEAVPVDVLAAVLVAVAALALVVRRPRPEVALVLTTAATATYLAIGYPYGPVMFSFAVAVFSIARRRPLRPALVLAGVALLAVLVHLFTHDRAFDGLLGVVPATSWVAVPFAAGLARRLVVEARARERAAADRSLVEDERLRLAHEVHDVVGHGLAAIQMQADIALHVRHERPEQPEVALRAISAASADALEELRATLTHIRPGSVGGEGGSRAPTAGVARVGELVDRVRSAGVEVDLRVGEGLDALPSATDLAVHRIVQESLTNVVRHSDDRRVGVRVSRTDAGVEVVVTNRLLHQGEHVPGFGIQGMRGRAEQLGGELTAGPDAEGQVFRVLARLPVAGDRDVSEDPVTPHPQEDP